MSSRERSLPLDVQNPLELGSAITQEKLCDEQLSSDDEDEAVTEHPARPTAPKKPTVSVPLPQMKPAVPQKPTVPPSPTRTPIKSHETSVHVPHETEPEQEAARPSTPEADQQEATSICPAVIVNDE
ncbi:hypothetical protein CSKR_202420, partial [Clonorchis sinensis]